MSSDARGPVISPDGSYLWDGKQWVESPKGTIQKFVWDGKKWDKVPAEKGGAIFSPDGQQMWTGARWIIAPPGENPNLLDDVPSIKEIYRDSPMVNFGNHNKEFKSLSPNETSISIAAIIFTFLITTSIFSSQIIQPLLFDAASL